MRELVSDLVNYVVGRVSDEGGHLSKTKLVKLLYFIDIEYYRSFGRTLTGWRWLFYHYGPYAFEFESATYASAARLDEEGILTSQGRKASTYSTDEGPDRVEESLRQELGYAGLAIVRQVVDTWALDGLYPVLDYAYYETEPMENAQRGELLDFSKVARVGPPISLSCSVQHRGLSPGVLASLRQRYQALASTKRGEPHPKLDPPPPYDEEYNRALEIMDAEDSW